jgi:hypothetical protein
MNDKPRISAVYPLVISTLALFLSGTSLFLQYGWKKHHLEAAVISFEPNFSGDTISAIVLVRNRGNQQETLLSGNFLLSGDVRTQGGVVGPDGMGPVILDPKVALLDTLQLAVTEISSVRLSGQRPDSTDVGIVFRIVDPSAKIQEAKYRIGPVKIADGQFAVLYTGGDTTFLRLH